MFVDNTMSILTNVLVLQIISVHISLVLLVLIVLIFPRDRARRNVQFLPFLHWAVLPGASRYYRGCAGFSTGLGGVFPQHYRAQPVLPLDFKADSTALARYYRGIPAFSTGVGDALSPALPGPPCTTAPSCQRRYYRTRAVVPWAVK